MRDYRRSLRTFRETIEPIAAAMYFVPEPLQNLQALGLTPIEAYFCGRAAPMGRVTGASVASLFMFFKPDVAIAAVEGGWEKVEPSTVTPARLEGISRAMSRILGAEPPREATEAADIVLSALESVTDAGRPLFAAWRNLEIGDDANLKLWRACDLFREHRGASHIAAWLVSGLHPREAVALSRHWWGMESTVYLSFHGWSKDDIDDAEKVLESLGYLAKGAITDRGVALRDEIEDLTDRMQRDVVEALDANLDELADAFRSVGETFIRSGGYPMRAVPSRAQSLP